ncbi:MAG: AEC family transporter [Clostridia bacterium]|nr:AEC family transporter [Clostridia bacterium]
MLPILIRAGAFVCLILLAYFFKKYHILRKEDFRVVSTLVTKATLPCAIITNFSKFPFDVSLFSLVLIGFLATLSMVGFGYIISRKQTCDERAFQMINHSGYNVGTFALPYLQSFVGASGVIYSCMFDIGNAILCTGGTYALASSVQNAKTKTTFGSLVKTTFSSVPLCTYLLMVILGVLHLNMPSPILTFTEIGASANSFLAMMMLGLGLELSFNKKQFKAIFKILAARYGFAALFSLAIWFLLPFSMEIRKVLVLLLFAPLASFDPIFTERCGLDVGLSSEINSLSILISLACMTVLFIVI